MWTNGRMREIGKFFGGNNYAKVAINERGQVVATRATKAVEAQAFVWASGRLT